MKMLMTVLTVLVMAAGLARADVSFGDQINAAKSSTNVEAALNALQPTCLTQAMMKASAQCAFLSAQKRYAEEPTIANAILTQTNSAYFHVVLLTVQHQTHTLADYSQFNQYTNSTDAAARYLALTQLGSHAHNKGEYADAAAYYKAAIAGANWKLDISPYFYCAKSMQLSGAAAEDINAFLEVALLSQRIMTATPLYSDALRLLNTSVMQLADYKAFLGKLLMNIEPIAANADFIHAVQNQLAALGI